MDLPFSITLNKDMFDDWDTLSDDSKEETISEYLSDEYGFCVNSFFWDEYGDEISVTEIDWDMDED